ncbi:MAG: MBL fold metallo-hydrolase [Deltaproteobacteria bacterium]|nr:MBL fold metallo-hydrolase [Deltaproteobacteria bacterium]
MKQLHRDDLFGWSVFDEARNVDFHGTCLVRDGGCVLIDPLPLSEHDLQHVRDLGGVSWVAVTNSDHTRGAADIAALFDAPIAGPRGEEGALPLPVTRWLGDGDTLVDGLVALEMRGSKTPGELAFLLDGTTLITGDLVRGQRGGRLNLLPDAKLTDRPAVYGSIRRLLELEHLEAVLVGDGWPVFRGGRAALAELIVSLTR